MPVRVGLCLLALVMSPAAANASVKRALLIGIDDYASADVMDLRGAGNDVALVKRMLIERLDFRDEDIVTLVDAEATRTRVLAAIDAAVETTGAEDFLYLHYSGHGSRVADASGDEADGEDETIIPHDGRTEGIADILDDEIDGRLAKLHGRALVVFDSCHSGTITRSLSEIRLRAVPPDTRVHLYQTRTRAVVEVPSLRHVLMTSAADAEEALDGPLDGSYYGFFSYALARAFEGLDSSFSARELYGAARAQLAQISGHLPVRRPEPQLEGPAELLEATLMTPLAAGGGRPRPPGAADLAALRNPDSAMTVTLALAGRFDCGDAPAVRGIRALARPDVAEPGPPPVRGIRHGSDPRTHHNSLQVRITSATDAFITLMYLDSEENLALMFPHPGHTSYLDGGRIRGGRPVCLPDTLAAENAAGFHWDFAPPAGHDTVALVATSDRESAKRVRRVLASGGGLPQTLAALLGELEARNGGFDWAAAAMVIEVR